MRRIVFSAAVFSAAIAAVCFPVWAAAQAPTPPAAGDHVNADEIIRKFAAKEKEFAEARNVRRALDDPGSARSAEAAQETHEHLRRLLNAAALESLPTEWLRQLPRYLKAEERRWQRSAVRGGEPPNMARELGAMTQRHLSLARRAGEELRWIPQLDELQYWIEEYRVSLYAQELKTLGPVSAARLEARAAEIEAWLTR